MKNDLVISFASESDITYCNLIDQNLGFQTIPNVYLHAIQENRLLVASLDKKIIGYLRYSWLWDEKLPYIQVVRIHKDYQQRGAGRLLIAKLEDLLKEKKIRSLLSSTEESNNHSLAFHKALGFITCGALAINDDGQREIFLKKDL